MPHIYRYMRRESRELSAIMVEGEQRQRPKSATMPATYEVDKPIALEIVSRPQARKIAAAGSPRGDRMKYVTRRHDRMPF